MSVFVGNISQQAAEEDLHWLFSQVGPVRKVRLPLDKESGKHRSFGFVDFHDEGTMQAAIVRMDGMELKGRALRVNAAETGPRGGASRQGDGGGMGSGMGAHYGGAAAAPMQEGYGGACPPSYGGACPSGYGAACPPAQQCGCAGGGQTSGGDLDTSSMSDIELWEIVSQMKEMVDQDVDQARRSLAQNPAMGLAVLRAQVQLGMVTPHSIAAVMSKAQAQQPAAQPPPPPQQQPSINPQQQALLQQVMQLTQEQIDQLPAEQRDQLLMLRQQVMSGQMGA